MTKIRFYDNGQELRDVPQTMLFYFCYIINTIQMFLVYFVLYFYIWDENSYSYFKLGGNNCELFYDLDLKRWIFFFFSLVNIIDIKFSFNIGKEFGNGLSIVSSFLASFVNFVIVWILGIYYIRICNTDGINVPSNICRDARYCGEINRILNPNNFCNATNPFALPLEPTVLEGTLRWNSWFGQFFIILILLTIGTIAKTIFQFLLPSDRGFYRISKFVRSAVRSGNQQLIDGLSGVNAIKKVIDVFKKKQVKDLTNDNLFATKKNFFTFWKGNQVVLYIITFVVDFIFTIMIAVWGGWFMQNAPTLDMEYVQATFATTRLKRNLIIPNYLFYLAVGLNTFPSSLTIRLGNMFNNYMAIASSIFGIVLNVILVIYSFFVYTLFCNSPISGYNICNNRCWYCATYFANPNNFCRNTVGCDCGPYMTNSFDFDYILLQVILFYGIISFSLVLLTSLIMKSHFDKIREWIKIYNKKHNKYNDEDTKSIFGQMRNYLKETRFRGIRDLLNQ